MLGHLKAEGQGLGQKAAPIPTSHGRHKEGDFMAYPPCNLDLVVRGQGFGGSSSSRGPQQGGTGQALSGVSP